MAHRLKQVIDLYITGKVVTLADGTTMWVQALNPFEHDTARNEAQIAKSRITMALKEFGGDEQAMVKGFFFEEGTDVARSKIIDSKVAEAMPRMLERLRSDPEWAERFLILERGLANTALAPGTEEYQLLEKISTEYTDTVAERIATERAYQEDVFLLATEDELWESYLEWYLNRRAGELMIAEFKLHQLLFGTRWCNGTRTDGAWDHSACDSHRERVFDTKDEVKDLPEELIAILAEAADEIEMTAREAKNSPRQGSSSDSSPLPSEAVESTASTPTETPVAPPGTSSSLFPTPSPSLATAS